MGKDEPGACLEAAAGQERTTMVTGPREPGSTRPGQAPLAQAPGAAQPGSVPPGQAAGGPPAGHASPGTPVTDPELLRRHVDGDPEAFGVLFLRHRDRLWAVALRTLGDPEEAADALQDAMISAFRRADGFRGDSAVTTWLHRIVVNSCLDRLRRRAARPVSAGLNEQALDLLTREPQVPDHGADTDTALEVMAALRSLPAEQRAALVLVDMLGYPVADAAAVLDVSIGTIKSRCARGRARLVPRLAHLRGGQPGDAPAPPRQRPPQPAFPPSRAMSGPGGSPGRGASPDGAPAGGGPAGSAPLDGGAPAGGPGGQGGSAALAADGSGPAPGPDRPPPAAGPAIRNPAPPGCVSPAERGGDSRL